MPDSDPSAILAGIKERAEAAADFPLAEYAGFRGPGPGWKPIVGQISASAADVPLLLGAIDAALGYADLLDANLPHVGPDVPRQHVAAVLRERVRGALTGKDSSDE
jgi:hypothetical protein